MARGPAASGTFTLAGTPPPATGTISPTSAALEVGTDQQFTATTSDGSSVTWRVNGINGGNATVGTIDGTGLYTAPAAVPTPDTVVVGFVSTSGATASANVTIGITVPPPPPPQPGTLGWSDPSDYVVVDGTIPTPPPPPPERLPALPVLSAGGDRRALPEVWLRPASGRWVVLGTDLAPGVVPEDISVAIGPQGPDTASFRLRRSASVPWPDLAPFTPCEIWIGGQKVWGGRLAEEPTTQGADGDSVDVQARGWATHLDDDPTWQRLFVDADMSKWQSVREGTYALSVDVAKFTTDWQAGGNPPTLAWGSGDTTPTATTYPGIIYDGGYAGACKRVVVNGLIPVVWPGGATLKVSYSDTLPVPVSGADFSAYSLGAAGEFVVGVGLAVPSRYVLLWIDQNGTGSWTGQEALTCKALYVHGENLRWANPTTGASTLPASDVFTEALLSGKVPLLSADTSGITATTFSVPSFTADGSVKDALAGAAAFHDYDWGVDAEARVFFRPKPTTALYEVGAWSGADIEDAGLSGEEMFDRVLVTGTGPDGGPIREFVTASVPLFTRQGFHRTFALSVDGVVTADAARQIGAVWLADRSRTLMRGSVRLSAHGGCRRADTGDPVAPHELCFAVGQWLRLAHRHDPDTGAWGRLARVASVTYAAGSGEATLALDSDRGQFDALLRRFGAIEERVVTG